MSDRHFTLDTNILVYALDRQAGARHGWQARSLTVLRYSTNCWLTLQSISEFYAAATRKRLVPVTASARSGAGLARACSPSPRPPPAPSALRSVSRRPGRASYWDALLVITAAEAGCTAILTEDLADDSTLAGVRVINPFAGAALSAAAEALLTLD